MLKSHAMPPLAQQTLLWPILLKVGGILPITMLDTAMAISTASNEDNESNSRLQDHPHAENATILDSVSELADQVNAAAQFIRLS